MSSLSPVGVHDDFPTSYAGISNWAADNKSTSGVDVVFSIIIYPFVTDRLDNLFNHISLNSVQAHIRMMLRGKHDSIYTFGNSVFVFNRDLRFSIWAEAPQLITFSCAGQALGYFVS